MKTLTAPQLAEWLKDAERTAPFLLDVREPWEFDTARIPETQLIPMRQVPARLEEIDRERPVVCVCHHGARSMQVAMFLENQGFAPVYNLTGGTDAWSRQVDPGVPVY